MIAFHMTQTRIAKDLGLFEDARRSVRDVQLPTFSVDAKTSRESVDSSIHRELIYPHLYPPVCLPLSGVRACVRLSPSFTVHRSIRAALSSFKSHNRERWPHSAEIEFPSFRSLGNFRKKTYWKYLPRKRRWRRSLLLLLLWGLWIMD